MLFGRLSRTHAVALWSSALVYTAADVTAMVYSDTAAGTTGDIVFCLCLGIGMFLGGFQAIGLTALAAAKHWPSRRAGARRRGSRRRTQDVTGPASLGSDLVGRVLGGPPTRAGKASASSKTTPTGYFVSAVACLTLGAVLFAAGVRDLRVESDLDQRGVRAAATVTRVEHRSSCVSPGGCSSSTDVTVTYTDRRGVSRRATHDGRDATKVGAKLEIEYDPQQPTHVRWRSDVDDRWLFLVYGGILALMGLWAGIGWLRAARRTRRSKRAAPDPVANLPLGRAPLGP